VPPGHRRARWPGGQPLGSGCQPQTGTARMGRHAHYARFLRGIMGCGERRNHALLKPDLQVSGVWEIDLDCLSEKGIAGIILDIDNTLAPWGSYEIPDRIREWVEKAKSKGFGLCILTNNYSSRADWFSRELDVPAVKGWVKPWAWGYRMAMRELGTDADSSVMVGDQLFTDIRGANRLGIYSILVSPLSNRELFHTRIKRRFEKMILGDKDER
jgi:HAD superfamily phosphatase (TIGR01668 family)